VSATATQINSQMLQGSVGINDKKSDIARAMEWVDRYCLKLCMQYWDEPFWSNLGTDYVNSNTFVDMTDLLKAPTAVPIEKATSEKIEKRRGMFSWLKRPKIKADIARDTAGEIIYTEVDFDTKVFIGKGIARGKTDMYNILQGLARTILIGANGEQIGAITPERWIELMEQTLGMKLRTEDEVQNLQGAQFDQQALAGTNPVGNNNTIQMPQSQVPDGLMQNVPQQPGNDNRNVVI
jgi:hypothetical protein